MTSKTRLKASAASRDDAVHDARRATPQFGTSEINKSNSSNNDMGTSNNNNNNSNDHNNDNKNNTRNNGSASRGLVQWLRARLGLAEVKPGAGWGVITAKTSTGRPMGLSSYLRVFQKAWRPFGSKQDKAHSIFGSILGLLFVETLIYDWGCNPT